MNYEGDEGAEVLSRDTQDDLIVGVVGLSVTRGTDDVLPKSWALHEETVLGGGRGPSTPRPPSRKDGGSKSEADAALRMTTVRSTTGGDHRKERTASALSRVQRPAWRQALLLRALLSPM